MPGCELSCIACASAVKGQLACGIIQRSGQPEGVCRQHRQQGPTVMFARTMLSVCCLACGCCRCSWCVPDNQGHLSGPTGHFDSLQRQWSIASLPQATHCIRHLPPATVNAVGPSERHRSACLLVCKAVAHALLSYSLAQQSCMSAGAQHLSSPPQRSGHPVPNHCQLCMTWLTTLILMLACQCTSALLPVAGAAVWLPLCRQ